MSKINKGLMTSNTDLWATPQDFFDQQNVLYGPFTVDVCADAANAKCLIYFDKITDLQEWAVLRTRGLGFGWLHSCWLIARPS